jgi:AraC-like DNA-binding protein
MTTFVPPARHLLRAKDLADARYFDALGVDDLARAAGLSRAHFSREFRAAFGESPHSYLLTRRMERAAALLRTTDRPVLDICFSVGLRSVGSFTSSFKRTYGLSPTEYRASHPDAAAHALVPACVVRFYGRPQHSTFGEDTRTDAD